MAPSKSSAGPAGETGVPEPGDGIDYRRILGPLDGSALAEQALPVAVWLAIVPVFPQFFRRWPDRTHVQCHFWRGRPVLHRGPSRS